MMSPRPCPTRSTPAWPPASASLPTDPAAPLQGEIARGGMGGVVLARLLAPECATCSRLGADVAELLKPKDSNTPKEPHP